MSKHRTWRQYLLEKLSTNREEAIDYIQVALEEYQVDADVDVLLLSLHTFVEAQAGITELAKRVHMSPDALHKVLSSDKAPHLDTLCTILNALGCRLSVVPLEDGKTEMETSSEDQRISAAG